MEGFNAITSMLDTGLITSAAINGEFFIAAFTRDVG